MNRSISCIFLAFLLVTLVASRNQIQEARAAPAISAFYDDLNGFNIAAGFPPIAINFDDITPGTDVANQTIRGVTFKPNLLTQSAALMVVRANDTYSPPGFGPPATPDNKLFATSGENVLSPGGIILAPGTNITYENDDLTLIFPNPVSAVGFDLVLQELDGDSSTSLQLLDASDNILYQIGLIPTVAKPGWPGGAAFVGFVSNSSNIAKIVIDDYDQNSVYPDCNIGFDTIRFSTKLYGVIGNHLVMVNQLTGNATEIGTINASDLWGLTYDPCRDALYCIANHTTNPTLTVIDRTTAEVTTIGPIDLEGYPPTFLGFVESLAFNPLDGILYGSAGSAAYLSDKLIRIDPETGNATSVAQITGTTQNDGDSMVFIDGTLYLVDSTPYSTLYTINCSTGVAAKVGDLNDFAGVILAYDTKTQTLFGSARNDRLLIAISPYTGQCTDIGPTHTADEFEGSLMGLLAVAVDSMGPTITGLSQTPPSNDVQPYQNVTVSANIADISGVKNATLFYTLDNGTSWADLAMNLNTTTDQYQATIPGQPLGIAVRFKILAFDNAENNATKEGMSSDYTYIVIPEFPSLLILPFFMIATLITIVLFKRRHSVKGISV